MVQTIKNTPNGQAMTSSAHFDSSERADLGSKGGIFPCQKIRNMIKRGMITCFSGDNPDPKQIQPASLDLRLGKKAYRVRASFLPGPHQTVKDQLKKLQLHEFSLEDGAVLEKDCVYVVDLEEVLKLPASVSAVANPKSSTGRLDVFTRLITDNSETFDYVEPGYHGQLYAEISPRTFGIKVRSGTTLNQLRFRRWAGPQDRLLRPKLSNTDLRNLHKKSKLVDGEATIREGLIVRVDLTGEKKNSIIGYRAQKHTGIIDVDCPNSYKVDDFWEPIRATSNKRLILDPGEFYILASKEALHVPPAYAAEMLPIDPMMGEFRAHYAGFFDPGFGHAAAGGAGSRAVLEVRSHDVPFIIEDGQIIARLVYEELTEKPDHFYGQEIGSNYQSQGLKLSKHFKQKSTSRRSTASKPATTRKAPTNKKGVAIKASAERTTKPSSKKKQATPKVNDGRKKERKKTSIRTPRTQAQRA